MIIEKHQDFTYSEEQLGKIDFQAVPSKNPWHGSDILLRGSFLQSIPFDPSKLIQDYSIFLTRKRAWKFIY